MRYLNTDGAEFLKNLTNNRNSMFKELKEAIKSIITEIAEEPAPWSSTRRQEGCHSRPWGSF